MNNDLKNEKILNRTDLVINLHRWAVREGVR